MRVSVGGFTDYQLAEDGRLILLSLSGKLYVFDRDAATVRELKTGQGTLARSRSSAPTASQVAYVRDHDVYVYRPRDAARRSAVTTGGTAMKTHGLAEFVAQEEMGRLHRLLVVAGLASRIAYEEADHAGVEVWYVADPIEARAAAAPEQFYPRPGKKNVAVRLGVVPVARRRDGVGRVGPRASTSTWRAVRWDKARPADAVRCRTAMQQELAAAEGRSGDGQDDDAADGEGRGVGEPRPGRAALAADGGRRSSGSASARTAPQLELRDADGEAATRPGPAPPSGFRSSSTSTPKTATSSYAAGARPDAERTLFRVGRWSVRAEGRLPGLTAASRRHRTAPSSARTTTSTS